MHLLLFFSVAGLSVRGVSVNGGNEAVWLDCAVVILIEEEMRTSLEGDKGFIVCDVLLLLELVSNARTVVAITAVLVLDDIALDADGLTEVFRDDCSFALDSLF